MEAPVEFGLYRFWRARLWERVATLPGTVLEIGAGTGRNFRYHPNRPVLAVDISPKMLAKARSRRRPETRLAMMDAQRLALPQGSIDIAVGTFVFCSIPDPIAGLRELRRALAPGGRLFLLEHVLLNWWPARPLMNALNPLVRWLTGANINRDTEENVREAGFRVLEVEVYIFGLFKRIEASAPPRLSRAEPAQ